MINFILGFIVGGTTIPLLGFIWYRLFIYAEWGDDE